MVEDVRKKEALAKVRRIIVHPGLAHVDDIMSCALAYACGVPHNAAVERRRPTAEDLDDRATLVLDVGFVHDPERLDFDHHARDRNETPKCSYVLLAEWLGVADTLKTLFPWYEAWNLIDVWGPFATAAHIGTTAAHLAGFVAHPMGDWAIRHFADDPAFRAKLTLGLAKEIDKTYRVWQALKEKATFCEVAGFGVLDLCACGADEISRASDVLVRERHPACLISHDNRGTGLTFLRCEDDPRLDFSRCAGKPYALFAHPGGFLLKTHARDVDRTTVLNDARVE